MHHRHQLPRAKRLHLLIDLLNRIHCQRRLAGRPTAHLHPRCRALTTAYLQATSSL